MTRRYGVTKAVRQSLLATLLLPGLALAEPVLDLQYSTFYSQMKTFAKGEFGHARLGFYLTDPQNGQRCGITFAGLQPTARKWRAR